MQDRFAVALLALAWACDPAIAQGTDNPFAGRSITYRVGYTMRTCLRPNIQCRSDRVAFGTFSQLFLTPEGEVEVFTHSEHTYRFPLGRIDERGEGYQLEGRDLIHRAGGLVWTFRAQGRRCMIAVRAENRADDPVSMTATINRQTCEITDGRRPWSQAD
jgi:hypothetical protein